jgi:hypothetical protein
VLHTSYCGSADLHHFWHLWPVASNSIYCEFWGFRSDVADGSILLGFGTASLGSRIPTFWDSIASKRRGYDYPVTQHLIPEEQKLMFPSRACLFSKSARPAPTQHPVQWVWGALSPGIKQLGREVDLHLEPRSRTPGAILAAPCVSSWHV